MELRDLKASTSTYKVFQGVTRIEMFVLKVFRRALMNLLVKDEFFARSVSLVARSVKKNLIANDFVVRQELFASLRSYNYRISSIAVFNNENTWLTD